MFGSNRQSHQNVKYKNNRWILVSPAQKTCPVHPTKSVRSRPALLIWSRMKNKKWPKKDPQLFVKQHQTENGIFYYPKTWNYVGTKSVTEDFSRSVNLERVSIKNREGEPFLTQFLPSQKSHKHTYNLARMWHFSGD